MFLIDIVRPVEGLIVAKRGVQTVIFKSYKFMSWEVYIQNISKKNFTKTSG